MRPAYGASDCGGTEDCEVPLNLTAALPDILDRIVFRKRAELAESRVTWADLEKHAEDAVTHRRDFAAALRARRPAILAEIKKASPSKGLLSENFDPRRIAVQYESGGAAAISVLTDHDFFQGSLADLEAARASVAIPVLRKDFTIDPYHVIEAAAHGSDAILLIAAILDERRMRDLRELAARYRMDALVEIHDARELAPALASGAEIIGVNNRDLRTFEVRLQTSLELIEQIPASVLKLSESGIYNAADVRRLTAAGFDAFLVGEHLMRSPDPTGAIEELLGGEATHVR